jgi:hypothetical protein
MPRAQRKAPPPKAPPKRDVKKSLDEEAEVTALDMAVLNEFIHDTERSDTLRLAALKVKVGREAALLKERIAEKTSGMNIVVNTLSEDEDGDT